MSTLTTTQFRWLQWLAAKGGKAWPKGVVIVDAQGARTNSAATLSFVHLVAKGAVTGRDGYLEITDYGRRLLTP